jgi:threonine aldolase
MDAVDLRSDTVTRPTPAMRQAMARAEVGDDVFDEDPTVHALQALGAEMVGQEAALFVPSGTMANQIALLSQTRPGDEVLVGEGAHIQLYESGAGAALAGVQFSVVGEGGHFDAEEMAACVQRIDDAGHIPPTTLLAVENTHNRGGGMVMAPEAFQDIAARAQGAGLAVHLDGARLFNAAAARGVSASAWGAHASSVSVCLSKGLGAPAGSLLCGSTALIRRAHRFRKMMGGGMRQVGILAAGGLHALRHHVVDLAADHRRARSLAEALAAMPGVRLDPASVQTNIVIFSLDGCTAADLCAQVAGQLKVLPFGPNRVRAVTHRDVDDSAIERAIAALRAALT